MPEFLTEEWFETLAAALASLPAKTAPVEALARGLRVGQVVTGVPGSAGASGVLGSEVHYIVELCPDGSVSVVRGSTEDADVTIVEDFATAKAIAAGTSSVSDMLNVGKVKLRGDTRALLAAAELLAVITPLLAEALAAEPGLGGALRTGCFGKAADLGSVRTLGHRGSAAFSCRMSDVSPAAV